MQTEKNVINGFIKALRKRYANRKKLPVHYIYTGWFTVDTNSDGVLDKNSGGGAWCSHVINDLENLYFYPELNMFYYRGETEYGEFFKAEFVLSRGLKRLLPMGLKEAMVEVAKNKTDKKFNLPTNLLAMS